MSLIQQALKRKSEEQHGKNVQPPPPLSGAPLAAPPPMPPVSPPPPLGAPVPPMPASPNVQSRLSLSSAPPPVAPKTTQPMPPPITASVPPPLSPLEPLATPPSEKNLPPRPGPAASTLGGAQPVEKKSAARLVLQIAVLAVVLLLVGLKVMKILNGAQKDGSALSTAEVPATPKTPAAADTKGQARPDALSGAKVTEPSAHETSGTTRQPPTEPDTITAVKSTVEKMKDSVQAAKSDARETLEQTVAPPAMVKPPPMEPAQPPAAATVNIISIPTPVGPAQPGAPATGVSPAPSRPAAASTVAWPAVKISGVMAHASFGQRSAIVNDVLINVGENVDGLTLVEVKESSVLLEFKGETRSFNVGRRK